MRISIKISLRPFFTSFDRVLASTNALTQSKNTQHFLIHCIVMLLKISFHIWYVKLSLETLLNRFETQTCISDDTPQGIKSSAYETILQTYLVV